MAINFARVICDNFLNAEKVKFVSVSNGIYYLPFTIYH